MTRALALVTVLVTAACGRSGYDPALTFVVPAFPTHGGWNQYVQRGDGAVWSADDVDCDVASDDCVHAGEIRRYDVPSEKRCAGLTASDARQAFIWQCDDSGGHAVFYSVALRGRLADLLNGTSFATNVVTVSRDAKVVKRSAPAVWWANPVLPMPPDEPSGTTSTRLDQPYAIYVATSASTRGYRVVADGVSIVVPRGVTLTLAQGEGSACTVVAGPPPGTRCIVQVDGRSFGWIEGAFNAVDALGIAIGVNDAAYIRVRNTQVQHGRYALLTTNAHAIYVAHFRAAAMARYGVIIYGGDHQRFVDTTWSDIGLDNGASALLIDHGASDIVVASTVIDAALPYAVQIFPASGETAAASAITIAFATIVNGNADGLVVDAATGVSVTQTIIGNRAFAGVNVGSVAAADVEGADIALCSNQTDTAVAPGSSINFTTPVLTPSGAAAGFVGATQTTSSFVDLDNWVDASPYRTWNADGTFPSPSLQSGCTSGTCRLFDWRLNGGSLAFQSASAAGQNTFAAGSACPPMTATTDSAGNTFLIGALEILDDGRGDDDGLCEQSEACIFAPHIGAYQGEGDLTEACDSTDSAVADVTLYAFAHPLASD